MVRVCAVRRITGSDPEGSGNMPVYRKIRQKPLNLGRAHRTWMALAVAQDEAAYPRHIGLRGAQAVVFEPQTASNLGQQTRWLLHLTSSRYTLGFACVNHYAHRFADMQRNLIAVRSERSRASS